MFFQLQEINAIQLNVSTLEQSKQSLYKCMSSGTHVVRRELSNVINSVLGQAQKLDKTISQIIKYAEDGYLIPTEIDIDGIIENSDEGQLPPEWFAVVFQSEYSKQIQSINITAKKSLNAHALSQSLLEYQRQVQAFKLLHDRYKSMPNQDILDIMGEAEAIKNKGQVLRGRGNGYCEDISGRIADFVKEILSRASKFRQGISLGASMNNTTNNFHARQYEYRGYPTRHPSSQKQTSTLSTSPSVTCPNFRCTAGTHLPAAYSRYVPRWINNSRSGMILGRDY